MSPIYMNKAYINKIGVGVGQKIVMVLPFSSKIIHFEIAVPSSGYFGHKRNEDVSRWPLDSAINILCYPDMHYLSLEHFLLVDRF